MPLCSCQSSALSWGYHKEGSRSRSRKLDLSTHEHPCQSYFTLCNRLKQKTNNNYTQSNSYWKQWLHILEVGSFKTFHLYLTKVCRLNNDLVQIISFSLKVFQWQFFFFLNWWTSDYWLIFCLLEFFFKSVFLSIICLNWSSRSHWKHYFINHYIAANLALASFWSRYSSRYLLGTVQR